MIAPEMDEAIRDSSEDLKAQAEAKHPHTQTQKQPCIRSCSGGHKQAQANTGKMHQPTTHTLTL